MTAERYRISPGLAWEEFPEEIVAIDLERGVYFNLNEGGMDVFRAFLAPATVADVVAFLAPRFRASEAEVALAVVGLVKELVDRQVLVETRDEPSQPSDAAAVLGEPKALSGLVLHVHEDLQDLIFIDPVHDTDDAGWPALKP